jgi:hypothetical protein
MNLQHCFCVCVPFFGLCNTVLPVWFDILKSMLVFRPLCENYVIKWTRQGMAKDLDQLNNFKVSTVRKRSKL